MMLSGSRITQLDLWFGYVNAFFYILLKYFIYYFAIEAMIVTKSKLGSFSCIKYFDFNKYRFHDQIAINENT